MTPAHWLDALAALAGHSPIGAGLALAIVAMIVGLILIARSKSVFEDAAAEKRRGDFQAQLLGELEKTRLRETEMRTEIADLRALNARLAEALAEVRVQLELLRGQTRRLIDQLRDVREGRRAADDVDVPELGG